jgi:predicted DNA-binding transcriptional regulator YafY
MNQLISGLDTAGLLGPHIKPLLSRITALLGSADDSAEQVKRRVKVETIGSRGFELKDFQVIGSALLKRKRLLVEYYARGSDEVSIREISPQRLIYYRDNWYLDAWCYLRDGLRSFSVDTIKKVELLEAKSEDISDDVLDEELGSGYGIFGGQKVQLATLLFTPERARWVANEKWHPKQEGRFLEDGSYELKVPFSDSRELEMDILKYGPDVKVISPDALRVEVLRKVNATFKQYEGLSDD